MASPTLRENAPSYGKLGALGVRLDDGPPSRKDSNNDLVPAHDARIKLRA